MSMDLLSEPITESEKQQFCVDMMKRLDIQRRKEQFCDVILEVCSGDDQARLKAHKIVLCAASPFFNNALNSDMKEKKEGVIRLEETSKAMVEEVLEYMYTGHVDINEQNVFDLLKIADYLIISSLKILSRDFILQTLSPSSSFMAYYYAGMYLDPELEEIAQSVTFLNFLEAAESDDFLNLSVKQMEEWVSSDQIVVEEEEQIFQIIVNWMEKSENSKDQSFFQLFRHVRLVHVSRNYIFDVILPHPFVKNSKLCSEFVFDVMQEFSNGTEDCYFAQPPRDFLQTHCNSVVVIEETLSWSYIASEDKWYSCDSMMEHMLHNRKTLAAAMTTCHGKLYVVGGNDKGPAAECYDPLKDSCYQLKSFNLKTISYAGVVCFQGNLYVIGGEASAKTRLSSVLKYNPETDVWHRVSPLSISRSSVCAVADSRSLYVIGGNSSTGYLDIAERYDPDADSWSKIPSTIWKRAGACGAVIREKVFVFGGLSSTTAPSGNFIEMYDSTANNWISMNSAIGPRGFSRAVSVKGQVFVLGCFEQDDSLEGVTSLWMYDVNRNEWKPCCKPPFFLDEPGLLSLLRVPCGWL